MDWPVKVELGSDLETRMRKEWGEHRKWELRAERHRRRQESRRGSPLEMLRNGARKSHDEDILWMPAIIQALQLDENGEWKFLEDQTQSYAWQHSDEQDRNLALSACVKYLAEIPIPSSVGAEEEGTLLSGWAAFGLVLLCITDQDLLQTELSAPRMAELAPHLIDGLDRSVPRESQTSLGVNFLWRQCPTEVTQGILAVLSRKADGEHLPSIFYSLPVPFPSSLGHALLDAVRRKHADQKVAPEVVGFLIAHEVPGAFEFALGRAGEAAESEEDWKARRAWLRAAVRAAPARVWTELNQLAARSDRWAREAMSAAVSSRRFHDDHVAFQDGLSDEQLAELARMLFRHRTPESDKRRLGSDGGADDEEVRRWRGQVLNTMVVRGTIVTVQALRELSRDYPRDDWLKYYVLAATTQRRRHAWNPPAVSQLIEMEADAERRLVRSGSELLFVVVESLRAWERQVRGEDLVRSLWDQRGKGSWRPKDEEHLSQTLAAWLKKDLQGRCMTAGRELQLSRRSSKEGLSGTRVDIDVVAAKDGDELQPIRAVVEVKGDWHKKVKSAMQDQLVGQYFAEGRYQYGLYVVGRYSDAKWNSVADAQAELDAQIQQLKLPSSEALVEALVLDCSLT